MIDCANFWFEAITKATKQCGQHRTHLDKPFTFNVVLFCYNCSYYWYIAIVHVVVQCFY